MPVPRTLRRPLAAALALVLASAVTGCGDDGPTTTSAATTPPAMAAQGARGGVTATPDAADDAVAAYLRDGRSASSADAAAVRAGFRAFATAVVDRDAEAACARVVGFEELLRARGLTGTCRRLLPQIGNAAAGPSRREFAQIDTADVVRAGDRATISVGGQAPVPMRLDGQDWKLDYAAFAAAPKD